MNKAKAKKKAPRRLPFAVTLPPDLHEKITKYCFMRQQKPSEFVIMMAEEFLDTEVNKDLIQKFDALFAERGDKMKMPMTTTKAIQRLAAAAAV